MPKAKYVMKFLWFMQWPNFDHEPEQLSNFGRTTLRKEPNPDVVALFVEPIPENGFEEVAIELAAGDLAEAKLEAWDKWETQPYGEEAQGYVIEEAGAAFPQASLHQYMIGFDGTPEGKILNAPEFPSWRSSHPVDACRAAVALIEDHGDDAPISMTDELPRPRARKRR
jgi:hypothetical protein